MMANFIFRSFTTTVLFIICIFSIISCGTDDNKEQESNFGSSGEIIGKWADDIPYVEGKHTLFKDGDKIVMKTIYNDGSGGEYEMLQSKESGHLRFEKKEGNDFGEYYLLDNNGNLNVFDKEGFIATYRAID